MKKLINNLSFYFDYYVGYFMHSDANNTNKWGNYIVNKYPGKFPNEVKYLEQLKKANKQN